jgi:anti-sigma B factor antagonist
MGRITEATMNNNVLKVTVTARRLDAASARDFKGECEAAWTAAITAVEIDLAAVEFVDSSGVGALLSIYKKLPSQSSGVKLLRTKPAVQSVIELLRLHRIFELQA